MREFDLIVIGAGSGNSVIGPEFDDLSVALIDDGDPFGGTCLNAGCIPTKMFVRVADIAADAVEASRLGLDAAVRPVEWSRVRDRVFAKTDKISWAGFRYRDQKSPNVAVFRRSVRFVDEHTIETTDGERLHAPRIVIASGSRPRHLRAEFAPDDAVRDSDSIMHIESLPSSIVIVGGGAIAAEFAHVFGAFGSRVTIVSRSPRLMNSLDREIADRFTEQAAERWELALGETVAAIDRAGDQLVVTLESGQSVQAETVLVAIGRTPNTDTIGAAAVGFDLEGDGRLAVDEFQRVLAAGEPVDGVFALGDASSADQLKHVANHEARIVAHNLLHPGELRDSGLRPVPAAIFSHPQIAHFGLTEAQARAEGADVVVAVQDYRTTAYGWALEDTTSFCKLLVERSTGKLLGAHIIGPEASILIQPLIQIASGKRTIRGVARGQYWPHPAATEVVENALLKAEDML